MSSQPKPTSIAPPLTSGVLDEKITAVPSKEINDVVMAAAEHLAADGAQQLSAALRGPKVDQGALALGLARLVIGGIMGMYGKSDEEIPAALDSMAGRVSKEVELREKMALLQTKMRSEAKARREKK